MEIIQDRSKLIEGIEEFIKLTDDLFEAFEHFERDPFENGVEAWGTDEGSVKGWGYIGQLRERFKRIKFELEPKRDVLYTIGDLFEKTCSEGGNYRICLVGLGEVQFIRMDGKYSHKPVEVKDCRKINYEEFEKLTYGKPYNFIKR